MDRYFATYEAYGEPKKEPIFLYSRHNLQLKYETNDPKKIVKGRIRELERYGYNALDRELSRDEKRAALFLDYLDALLQTYRQRVQHMECGIAYIGGLHSDWCPKIDINNQDPDTMIRMLDNFCMNIELCMTLIQDLQDAALPDFLLAWKDALSEMMENDHGIYICLTRSLIVQAGKK